MNPTLPDNFKQLSVSQQAIYAAEALREATDSNLRGDNATPRKRVVSSRDICEYGLIVQK